MKTTPKQLDVTLAVRCLGIARSAIFSIALMAIAMLGCQPTTMPDLPLSDLHRSKDGQGKSSDPNSTLSDRPEPKSWSEEAMLKKAGLQKQQISRNQTILIAVAPADVRTNTLAFSLLPHLSTEQRQQCRALVATYQDDFDAMLANRNDILDHIGGTEDTERELFAWKISMAELTRGIRRRMYAEILTDEQKREHLKKFPPKKKPK